MIIQEGLIMKRWWAFKLNKLKSLKIIPPLNAF